MNHHTVVLVDDKYLVLGPILIELVDRHNCDSVVDKDEFVCSLTSEMLARLNDCDLLSFDAVVLSN